jgi:hypothetical protein
VYTNVPGTLAVASNCIPLSSVPEVRFAGAGQVTVGAIFTTGIAGLAKAVRVKAVAKELAIRLNFQFVPG